MEESEVISLTELNSLRKEFDQKLQEGIKSGDLSAASELKEQLEQKIAEAEERIHPERKNIKAMEQVLGAKFEVKPLPASITPEVRRNLETFGFELVYLPKLELGTLAELQRLGEGRFLDEMQRRYPNWKHYERMSDTDKLDYSKSRNLSEWYWQLVKDETVTFPNLPGQWMAVEKMPKPACGTPYENTPMGARLAFPERYRFDVSWTDATKAIDREKTGLLRDIGLKTGVEMRMLEVLEWNLVANLKGWGATDTYEWTNTEYRETGDSNLLVAGYSDDGGAASISWCIPSRSYNGVGFRAAVVIGP